MNNEINKQDSGDNVMSDITADKKCLLTNIVQNAESLEKGILNSSFINNDETNVTVQVVVEDNKVTNIDVSIEKLQNLAAMDKKCEDSFIADKTLETTDENNSTADSLTRQKRRGICSEVELDFKSVDVRF